MVITRFAPSPTGVLHIGSARTALFNFLFAKRYKGKFILRIEDTDFKRSDAKFTENIISSLKILGIGYDELYFQSSNIARYFEVAQILVKSGQAYYCLSSKEEIETQKKLYDLEGKRNFIFQSPWRNKFFDQTPKEKFVIRFKTPKEGVSEIRDIVQGVIRVENRDIEDFIIVRNDQISTYLLACLVDDYDTSISHVIRGVDHINNAIKQSLIYKALNWHEPSWAHIPLLYDSEGNKLSKRSGILQYDIQNLILNGYLPHALTNYILRLGWSHGDDEIISQEQAINWFNLDSVGKSPAKFDFQKLKFVNNFYLKKSSDIEIMKYIQKLYLEDKIVLSNDSYHVILKSISEIKKRAHSILEIYQMSKIFYPEKEIEIDENLAVFVTKNIDEKFFDYVIEEFSLLRNQNFDKITLKRIFSNLSYEFKLEMKNLFQIFRIVLTAGKSTLAIYDIINILGYSNVVLRIQKFYGRYYSPKY